MAEATIPASKVVAKRYFDHIKWGGPCPPLNVSVAELVSDKRLPMDQESETLLLTQLIDKIHGTEEIVRNRRKALLAEEFIESYNNNNDTTFIGGSTGDGFRMESSDIDVMRVVLNVVVTTSDQIHCIAGGSINKSILLMRTGNCRPGYLTLELLQLGGLNDVIFRNAIVPIGDSMFVSSDIYRQGIVDICIRGFDDGLSVVSNGPCVSLNSGIRGDVDVAYAFSCKSWPKEANEWIHRTRLHGWPAQKMIDRIVHDGCHLVPVGDKCSADTLLQWRISFARAEQLLVHSLTHSQFRVYGLLKYFLTQIKDLLDHIIGDSDIFCSYFLKTVIFYSVENSPSLLWNDKNAFICFRFCLTILTAWVKSGYCPNYFIHSNNMFLRKVHGENRLKLLHFLRDCYDMKWPRMFLSVESVSVLDLEVLLQENQNIGSSQYRECDRDLDLFEICSHGFDMLDTYQRELRATSVKPLEASLRCLTLSETDVDEFVAYRAVVTELYNIASTYCNEYNTTCSNKRKYRALKKSKHLLTPYASMCTSPGLLMLATFHYLIGNYSRTLRMCADMMRTFKLYLDGGVTESSKERYRRMYCGVENTLYYKLKSGLYAYLTFSRHDISLSLPHLHLEITKYQGEVCIPPLPYATFLSFLCYHDLGDLRRRDTELINLRAANYDPEQGGHRYWIVHTLLGICYQTVGDNRRAIRSFMDSLRVQPVCNPAVERIEALRSSQ